MTLHPASRYFLTKGPRRRGASTHLLGQGDGAKKKRRPKMIHVTVEVRESVSTRRVRITAPSIELALKGVEEGKPRRGARLLFPIDPEAFFVAEGFRQREAA
jgi:hypothetical protein